MTYRKRQRPSPRCRELGYFESSATIPSENLGEEPPAIAAPPIGTWANADARSPSPLVSQLFPVLVRGVAGQGQTTI